MYSTMLLFQNLSNNQLYLEGADVIYKMLLDNCYVKSIKLSGDQLTSQDISHVHLCITMIQWKCIGQVSSFGFVTKFIPPFLS